ncbi:MAG: N-carbamoylputrescine amidase [Actinobacteria bacterium]|nr:N-carbamoylputrescine amidase [Actinomycetota bacterium]
MREVTLAATQMACTWETEANLDRAEGMVRQAAADGADVVLLQELFETPYFCIDQDMRHAQLARPLDGNPVIERFRRLAAELGVVLPLSFFERGGNAYFNSLAMIDADGAVLGVYRKSHIPNFKGYQEKHYFSPGDTGFKVWRTRAGVLGVGICWDQWFPEAARCMALMGAEILLYPTAIGSDPDAPDDDSRDYWQRVQQGHAVANVVPVVASNRVGRETGDEHNVVFYGSSFITDHVGAKLVEAGREEQTVLTATVDLDAARVHRDHWCFFRHRRPDLYGVLLTRDGRVAP